MRRVFTTAIATALVLSFSHAALAQVAQPNMQAALQDLYAAQQAIIAADQHHDHGGFAGAATRHINQAINDVNQGIQYRDTHGP